MNLQENPAEPYFACPYCLTKIKTIEEPQKIIKKPEEPKIEKTQPKENQVESKEKSKNVEKPSGCLHHPGFLSERSSKEQIPDECLVCSDIVNCMLKKMRE